MRTPFGGRPRARVAALAAVAISGVMVSFAPAAHAAALTTYTVMTANYGPGSGCNASDQCQTLTDALTAANAQAGSPGDTITVTFDSSIPAGSIIAPDEVASHAMTTASLSSWSYVGPSGSYYTVDQVNNLPVTVDFDSQRVGIVAGDGTYAGIYIKSPNVTIKDLGTIRTGKAGIAIQAPYATVSGTTFDNQNTWDMEAAIALLPGGDNASILNDHIVNPWGFGIWLDGNDAVANNAIGNTTNSGTDIKNLTVDGLVSDEGNNSALNTPYGDIWTEIGGNVTNMVVKNSTLANPNATRGHIGFQDGINNATGVANTVNGLTVQNDTFTAGTYGIEEMGARSASNVSITNSTFTNQHDAIVDGAGDNTNWTIQNNTFNKSVRHDIWFDQAKETNLLVDGNKFLDEGSAAETTVWITYAAGNVNNVISNNEFTMTPGNYPAGANHRWAIWGNTFGAAQGSSTGWSIVGNHIDGYGIAGSEAPIALGGTGAIDVQRNTFVNVQGTTQAAQSEAGGNWFLWNNGTNNRIQTWRPTAASFSSGKVAVTVAPVNPAENGLTNLPVGPVTVDVYWTATNQAEVYLGSFTNISSTSTHLFNDAHGAGYIRVQTTDANGQSSQYSGTVVDAQAPVPSVPVIKSLAANGNIAGTGTPGNTVKVFDAAGHIVATTTVLPNGQWAASVKPIKCGAVYTAREYDAFGQASARSAVFRAPACAPVITKVTTKAILGKGTPGNTVRVYNGKGKLVGTAKVKANGTWVLNVRSGTCGARYHAVQFNAQGVASKWSNIKVAPTRGCKASRPIVPGTPDTGMRRAM